jgi:hypothetical protein
MGSENPRKWAQLSLKHTRAVRQLPRGSEIRCFGDYTEQIVAASRGRHYVLVPSLKWRALSVSEYSADQHVGEVVVRLLRAINTNRPSRPVPTSTREPGSGVDVGMVTGANPKVPQPAYP